MTHPLVEYLFFIIVLPIVLPIGLPIVLPIEMPIVMPIGGLGWWVWAGPLVPGARAHIGA